MGKQARGTCLSLYFLPGHPFLRVPSSKGEGVTWHAWPWEEMLSQGKVRALGVFSAAQLWHGCDHC